MASDLIEKFCENFVFTTCRRKSFKMSFFPREKSRNLRNYLKTRVTRLGEFSPIWRLFSFLFSFGRFLKITEVTKFLCYFSPQL
jgi:hypothetical protein